MPGVIPGNSDALLARKGHETPMTNRHESMENVKEKVHDTTTTAAQVREF